MKVFLLGLTISLGVCGSRGISLPISRRDAPHSTFVNMSAASSRSEENFNFTNKVFFYSATVIVEGVPYTVQLDTGSSDLWVNAAVNGWEDTGYNTSLAYVDTTVAAGPIGLANVTFGDFSMEKQAVLSAPGSNATSLGRQGILGLASHFQSNIFDTLQNTSYNGNTLLDNIFSIYPNESNYITFLLTRSNIGSTSGGVFTIAETPVELSNISTTPHLPVIDSHSGEWITLMDGVEVNGVRYSGNSSVVSSNQTVVVLDTGTSAATAPAYYVDAMYKDLPGAIFDGETGYIVPCNSKVNISMVFGNHTYPIHPIDAVSISNFNDTTGSVICTGTFTYNPTDGVDFILGDAFLRNVYSLYDYGNWTTVGSTDPFMQILSITNPDTAWMEFETMVQARYDQLLAALLNSLFSGGNETTTVTVTETESITVNPGTAAVATSTASGTPLTPGALTSSLTSAAGSTGTSGTASSTSGSSSRPQNSAGSMEDFSIKGAIADDSSSSSSPSQSDLDTLIRNSYILIGLISGAILLILGLVASKFISRGSQRGYTKVAYAIPPAVDKPYSAEAAYSDSHRMPNPYSDVGH